MHQTLAGYVGAFTSLPWQRLPGWPPDVFCLSNLVLDHTEGYRFVVAAPPQGQWPPFPGWDEQVTAAAREWRAAAGRHPRQPPELDRGADAILLRAEVASTKAWTADGRCHAAVPSLVLSDARQLRLGGRSRR